MESISRAFELTGPRLGVVMILVALVGFGFGAWLGAATKPPTAAADTEPRAPIVATPSALSSPSASPEATPTEAPPPTQAPQPQHVVLTLEGDSHDVTDSFEVKPGWQIQWQVNGSSIAVAVTGEQSLGVLINEEGPASGVTGIAPGGVFQLEVAANGPWTITVLDGEEPAPSPS